MYWRMDQRWNRLLTRSPSVIAMFGEGNGKNLVCGARGVMMQWQQVKDHGFADDVDLLTVYEQSLQQHVVDAFERGQVCTSTKARQKLHKVGLCQKWRWWLMNKSLNDLISVRCGWCRLTDNNDNIKMGIAPYVQAPGRLGFGHMTRCKLS